MCACDLQIFCVCAAKLVAVGIKLKKRGLVGARAGGGKVLGGGYRDFGYGDKRGQG